MRTRQKRELCLIKTEILQNRATGSIVVFSFTNEITYNTNVVKTCQVENHLPQMWNKTDFTSE